MSLYCLVFFSLSVQGDKHGMRCMQDANRKLQGEVQQAMAKLKDVKEDIKAAM